MQGINIDVIKEKLKAIQEVVGENVEISIVPYKKDFGIFLTYRYGSVVPAEFAVSIEGVPLVGVDTSGEAELY